MEEAARGRLLGHEDSLRHVQMRHASLLDRLIVAVTDEYTREVERAGRSPERRRVELVLGLLAGRQVDSAELGYELEAWHLGVIATGKTAKGAVRALAAALDREPWRCREVRRLCGGGWVGDGDCPAQISSAYRRQHGPRRSHLR